MQKTILNPAATQALVPGLKDTRNPNVWVYRYTHPNGWRLSIATHAEPGSQKLSLGGFRIVPDERASIAGFDTDVEAIELAMGMEEKVYWSRIMHIGGPLARRDMKRIVGGTCVLLPTADSRVGRPGDRELIDFAIACLNDCDQTAGIRITTGQDLGHGQMADGAMQSLDYLHRGFPGSVVADTSKPTGEGNYFVLRGMLRAFEIPMSSADVGLIGAGNSGMHLIERLALDGARMRVIERHEAKRRLLAERGIDVRPAEAKKAFLREPMDALVVNASGGTLDTASVKASAGNERLRVICGSENLVMPHPEDSELYRAAGKAYCPTELGGMMGYLTAVEQYLAHLEAIPFRVETILATARHLEEPAFLATRAMIEAGFRVTFEEAVEARTALSTST